VFSDTLLEPLANVLQKLGSRHVLVVRARDGLDEISVGEKTEVAELRDGRVSLYAITPEQFGLGRTDISALAVDGPQESLAMIRSVLEDNPGPARDVVVLNAGAAVYAAGVTDSLAEGVSRADVAVASGEARTCLDRLVVLTQGFD
jgi:anthranilate phosphoribosyltransferase